MTYDRNNVLFIYEIKYAYVNQMVSFIHILKGHPRSAIILETTIVIPL